jgi:hypothetical protein
MTREDCITIAGIAGFALGWCLAKLDKLFDRWEARARSRKVTEER